MKTNSKAATAATAGTLTITPQLPNTEYGNGYAFAVIKTDGSVVAWGNKDYGGDISAVATQLNGTIDVTAIYSTWGAFAVLRSDGSVVTWGADWVVGDSSAVAAGLNGTIDVTAIYSNYFAFAALRADGSVVTWGDSYSGGDSSVYHYESGIGYVKDYSVAAGLNGTIDVTQIYSNPWAFAALRADGSVVTWGDSLYGGDSSAVAAGLNGTIDVTAIYSNYWAFAALRADGSVVTWGDGRYGGDSSVYHYDSSTDEDVKDYSVAAQLNGKIDVTQIYSNPWAFAALRADGSVITWGSSYYGGDSSVYHYDSSTDEGVKDYSVAAQLNGKIDVTQIYSNPWAFAALRADGSVVTWGNSSSGGDSSVYHYDSSTQQYVKDYSVAAGLNGTIDVTAIYSTDEAFAALRKDGSVVTWGTDWAGGDSSKIAAGLNGTIDITAIYSTDEAFAALRKDGSVVTWGNGGNDDAYSDYGGDSSAVAAGLNGTIDVTAIYSTSGIFGGAFAALRADGSVVTWGADGAGGDSSAVAKKLNGTIDVTAIYSNDDAFAALRADGSVVTWGNSEDGGDSRAVANQLSSGVVACADNHTTAVYQANGTPAGTVKSAVTHVLTDDFKDLILTGTDAINGTGNNLANKITGNSAANNLRGLNGDDIVAGKNGNDVLSGGAGKDKFVFDTALGKNNLDSVSDFTHNADKLQLDDDIFKAFHAGTAVSAGQFYSGAGVNSAHDANDRLIYNTSSGELYYDADGVGGTPSIQFVTLVGHPQLTASDFQIIA